MSSIAVIGLGAMGSRLARVAAGHVVVVGNRPPEKCATSSPPSLGREALADAARGSQTVIKMVADPPALAAVSEGQDGVAAAADDSTTVEHVDGRGSGSPGCCPPGRRSSTRRCSAAFRKRSRVR